MEADESGTLAQLRNARKEVIDPAIAVNSGRTLKTMGDGFLVEFASAQAAVACEVAIPQDMGTGAMPTCPMDAASFSRATIAFQTNTSNRYVDQKYSDDIIATWRRLGMLEELGPRANSTDCRLAAVNHLLTLTL
jgi:hypothetical protein